MFKKKSVSQLIEGFVQLQHELVTYSEEQASRVAKQKQELDASELELTRATRLKLKVDELISE